MLRLLTFDFSAASCSTSIRRNDV